MQRTSQSMNEVFFALCKSVNTPKSLAAWIMFKNGDKSFLDLSLRADDYTSATDFERDYLIVSFLSKYKGHQYGIDTKAVALGKFTCSETICRTINQKFLNHRLRGDLFSPRVDAVISTARRKIAAVLGPFDIVAVNRLCKWGPGATRGLPRSRCTVDLKHSEVPIDITREAAPYLRAHIESDPHWFEALSGVRPDGLYSLLPSVFSYTDSNRVVVVPKNAKTDRTIAAEPTGNSFLQQGVGRFIRRRLLSVGIDLDNQEINQVWASLAHTLDLATLDLSAASDTISRELVFELLPLDWALYLDRLRSPTGILPDGSSVKYEKFSSMGNAFTFELETLIFWSLAKSCLDISSQRGAVSVYGDDIIVPQRIAPLLVEVLQEVGFSVNPDKSFLSGRFFESCGKHYFDGFDVTPVFQKETLTNTPEFIRCGNRLKRWSLKSGFGVSLDPVVQNAWNCLRRHSQQKDPRSWDYSIPLGTEGDDGWLLSRDEWHRCTYSPSYSVNRGYLCRVLRPVARKRAGREAALLALWLRRSGEALILARPSLRVSIVGYDPSYGLVTPRLDPRYAVRKARVIPNGYFDVTW